MARLVSVVVSVVSSAKTAAARATVRTKRKTRMVELAWVGGCKGRGRCLCAWEGRGSGHERVCRV